MGNLSIYAASAITILGDFRSHEISVLAQEMSWIPMRCAAESHDSDPEPTGEGSFPLGEVVPPTGEAIIFSGEGTFPLGETFFPLDDEAFP